MHTLRLPTLFSGSAKENCCRKASALHSSKCSPWKSWRPFTGLSPTESPCTTNCREGIALSHILLGTVQCFTFAQSWQSLDCQLSADAEFGQSYKHRGGAIWSITPSMCGWLELKWRWKLRTYCHRQCMVFLHFWWILQPMVKIKMITAMCWASLQRDSI